LWVRVKSSGRFVDDVVAELGVDDDAGDVPEPFVKDVAGEVVGPSPL
jgi:hypothetical protein